MESLGKSFSFLRLATACFSFLAYAFATLVWRVVPSLSIRVQPSAHLPLSAPVPEPCEGFKSTAELSWHAMAFHYSYKAMPFKIKTRLPRVVGNELGPSVKTLPLCAGLQVARHGAQPGEVGKACFLKPRISELIVSEPRC